MNRLSITLLPKAPYDFDLTAAYATYFQGRYATDSFERGVFRRLLGLGDRLALVGIRSTGDMDAPCLKLEVSGESVDQALAVEAERCVRWILATDDDLAGFYCMAQDDASLAPLVRALRGLHVPRTASVIEALVLAILGQQVSAHVARMLRSLLVQTYGRSLKVNDAVYHAFPSPEALAEAGVGGLQAIKLSRRKAEYIAGIARDVASGELALEAMADLPDEEVVRVLTGIRGVGLWTAHWLFIRALGRTDGFPHNDLALRRGLGGLLDRGVPLSPEEALDYSVRWSPYRSYVTAYLFAAMRSGLLGV